MAFIKPLHRLFSHTSATNVLLPKSFPVATAVVKVLPPSLFIKCRSFHNYVTCTLYSTSDSSKTESDMSSYTPNPWLKSEPVSPCFIKEEDDVVKAKADLPGIGQNDVKVWIENSVICIKAKNEGEVKVDEEDVNVHDYDKPRSFSGAIQLPEGRFKVDEVKAQVKNGVLEIVIPKIRFQGER